MSSKPWTGVLEDSGGSWLGFGFRSCWGWVCNVLQYLSFEIQLSTLDKKVQRTVMPWSHGLELWRTLEVPNWSLGSWSWWGEVKNVPNNLFSEIQLYTFNKMVQRTLMSLKSWSGVVEDSGGSWPGLRFLIMIGMHCPWPYNSVDTSISPNGFQMAKLLTMDHVT